jgi:hypothetical protein
MLSGSYRGNKGMRLRRATLSLSGLDNIYRQMDGLGRQ